MALFVIKGAFDARAQRGLECPPKPVCDVAADSWGIAGAKVNLRAREFALEAWATF